MLTELGLRNFKAFGDIEQKAPMSNITLIYGPNSSGKSSIIQALLMLKQQLVARLRNQRLTTSGAFTDLGSYSALLHKHETDRQLGISCSFIRGNVGLTSEINMIFTTDKLYDDQGALSESIYKIDSGGATAQIKLERDGDFWEINNQESNVPMEYENLIPDTNSRYFLPLLNHDFRSNLEGDDMTRQRGRRIRRFYMERSESETELYRRERERDLHDAFSNIPNYFTRELRAISYLGPLRSHPERLYKVSEDNRESLTGALAPINLYRNPELLVAVNQWFKKLEIKLELKVESFGNSFLTGEYFSLALIDTNTNTPVTFADVGFGINQILPVIVEGVSLSSRRLGILCVEQPEIHIHPRLQAHIADLMIETTEGTHSGRQWIVETHSELLILRLQRRIRENRINADDVSVLYVNPQGAEGSTIQKLRLDEDGDFIDSWPDGFFDEGFNELMA